MARKLCKVCQLRPAGTGKDFGYEDPEYILQNGICFPCGNETQHEISHDNGHESISEAECWFCDPSKNEAAKPYAKRETKGHKAPRRTQLSHTGCVHAKTPKARRACRNRFWAEAKDIKEFLAFQAREWVAAGYVLKNGVWRFAKKR